MSSVLIVEDELIVARDIQNRLTRLGYQVVAVTGFGEEAIELAGQHRPNLVLMDIRLRGAIDGVTAAEEIRTRYGLAVVYLTAYADEDTLGRARVTEPCGYILKPFEERELRTVVEMGLYKHQVEHQLRESEKRYRNLVETVRDIIFTLSSDGGITSLSPAFEAISGWPCSAWVGKHFASLLHSDDLPLALEVFGRVLQGEQPPLFETRIITSAGDHATVEWKATPLRNEKQAVVGCTGIARDVTERKQLERQVAHAQKMETIGQLAGGVAHDFNNILTGIIGYTDLLLLRLDSSHPWFTDLEAIKKAAWLASSLTRQLLTFSRKQVREAVLLHVNQVAAGTEKMLRSLLGEHIELVITLSDDLPQVKADPGQLEHVIMNLALNARDAMPHGGTLTITTAMSRFDDDIQGAPRGEYVYLTIGDTGCGMSADVQSLHRQPFFTDKEAGKGTGLGLSSVYGIVKQSGGHIKVTSEVGRGTTFHIWLPACTWRGQDAGSWQEAR